MRSIQAAHPATTPRETRGGHRPQPARGRGQRPPILPIPPRWAPRRRLPTIPATGPLELGPVSFSVLIPGAVSIPQCPLPSAPASLTAPLPSASCIPQHPASLSIPLLSASLSLPHPSPCPIPLPAARAIAGRGRRPRPGHHPHSPPVSMAASRPCGARSRCGGSGARGDAAGSAEGARWPRSVHPRSVHPRSVHPRSVHPRPARAAGGAGRGRGAQGGSSAAPRGPGLGHISPPKCRLGRVRAALRLPKYCTRVFSRVLRTGLRVGSTCETQQATPTPAGMDSDNSRPCQHHLLSSVHGAWLSGLIATSLLKTHL